MLLAVDPCALARLAAKLSKLSKLFLCNIAFVGPHSRNFPSEFPVFSNIDELFISSRVDFPPFVLSELWSLVRSFTDVHTLTFRSMTLDVSADTDGALRLPRLHKLKQLHVLDSSMVIHFLKNLLVATKQQRLPALRALSVGRFGVRDTVEQLERVLDRLGGQLNSLTLQCNARLILRTSPTSPPDTLVSRLLYIVAAGFAPRITSCTNLVHLRLKMRPWCWVLLATLRLVERSSFPALENLTVEHDTALVSRKSAIHRCDEYSERLSPALLAMPSLKTVELRIPDGGDSGETFRATEREYVLEVLGDVDAKGILVVL